MNFVREVIRTRSKGGIRYVFKYGLHNGIVYYIPLSLVKFEEMENFYQCCGNLGEGDPTIFEEEHLENCDEGRV